MDIFLSEMRLFDPFFVYLHLDTRACPKRRERLIARQRADAAMPRHRAQAMAGAGNGAGHNNRTNHDR